MKGMVKIMTEKITKKDRYNRMIEILTGCDVDDAADLIDFCEHEIELLDKKSTRAKASAAEKKTEADPLTEAVKAALTDDFRGIADITNSLDASFEATTSKVGNRLSNLVKAGFAEDTFSSIPSTEGGKARKIKTYRLAQ